MTGAAGRSSGWAFRRRRVLIAGVLAVTVIVAIFVATAVGALATPTATRIGVGIVGALGLWLVASILQDVAVRPRDSRGALSFTDLRHRRGARAQKILSLLTRGFRRGRLDVRSPAWGELERTVRLAELSAVDFNVRLRRRLAVTIERRLRVSGIDPADRERVAVTLGEVACQILDPSFDLAQDRYAPGIQAAVIRDILRKVEALT